MPADSSTDHETDSTPWPGDNGNWTDYDNFVDQLITDLKANDMLPGLVYDIWNEADGYFWARSQDQFLDLYVRTHKRLRQDPDLASVIISGPSSASQPSVDNQWWSNWLSRVMADKVIPDYGKGPDPYKAINVHDYLSLSFFRQPAEIKASSSKIIDMFQRFVELHQ